MNNEKKSINSAEYKSDGAKMNQQELQEIFDKHKEQFDTIKQYIEKDIVKIECSNGMFYEIFPFYYQRLGFIQGKLIENIDGIKNMDGKYMYGFNAENKIIEIKEGISIKDEYYYQFIFYENNIIKTLYFENGKTLQNISLYYLDADKKINVMYSKGRRGGREEHYIYNEAKALERIVIKQFDRMGIEGNTIEHLFEYNNGNLKNIKKLFGNGDIEIIY